MRLADFKFPADTLPEILSRASEFNQYIQKVTQENFVRVGVSGAGEPIMLPGIMDTIQIGDSLLADSVETADKSGSIKIISGWADADITITLLLIDLPTYTNTTVTPGVTRYDCLADIVKLFKQIKERKPCIYTIEHPHLHAWRLKEFIFNDLKSTEQRGRRIITCTLEFDEYDSISGKSQDRQLGMSEASTVEDEVSVNPVVADETRRGLGKLEAAYAKL
jgi:hypothetical protein